MFGRYYEHYDRELLLHYCHAFALDKDKRWKHISKGEKLKFQFAFALSHRAKLLVLDEATSALDNETEAAVMEAIEHLQGIKTMIIIAHRLTTIQNAQKILVLTEDGIAEEGTHEELLLKKGIYEALYHRNFETIE